MVLPETVPSAYARTTDVAFVQRADGKASQGPWCKADAIPVIGLETMCWVLQRHA